MDIGVVIEVIYEDADLIELRIRANNGRFSGTAEFYGAHDVIRCLAENCRGFPKSSEDRREFQVGMLDPANGGGGAGVVLRCTDAVGHAVAEVHLRADPRECDGFAESASISVPVVAGAIDRFVEALESMRPVIGARAMLR